MKVPILALKPAYEETKAQTDLAYARVMDSGRYLLGRELESFEAEYAKFTGAAHCAGVANGLEALQLVLMAWGVGPGDEVVVPAHGYIATWLAASHVGATVVPCECDQATYNLDPSRLAAVLTARTKVILPIHLYGLPARIDLILELARPRGIKVLEDAAQSHGATWQGRQTGSLGDAAGVSFYPSKNLGALGDAGAVTTSDTDLAARVRTLRNYGSRVRYQNEARGLNSRMDELQAAFLRVRLGLLSEWNARRARIAATYLARLPGWPDLVLPTVPEGMTHAWHLFVVRTPRRDALRSHLEAAGVETQIHYPTPPHLSQAYAAAGWSRGRFPLAEQLANEVLSLPIGPHLAADQVDYTCDCVRSFFQKS